MGSPILSFLGLSGATIQNRYHGSHQGPGAPAPAMGLLESQLTTLQVQSLEPLWGLPLVQPPLGAAPPLHSSATKKPIHNSIYYSQQYSSCSTVLRFCPRPSTSMRAFSSAMNMLYSMFATPEPMVRAYCQLQD